MKSIINEITKEFFPDLGVWLYKISPFMGTVLVTEFIKKYIFGDFNYLIFVFVMMILDVLSKIYYLSEHQQKFDFEIMLKKFSQKFLKYMIFVSAMHVFFKVEIEGRTIEYGFYLKYLAYSLLITLDARSIFANLGIKLPAEIQRYFERNKSKETEEDIKINLPHRGPGGNTLDGGDGPSTPPVKPPKP
jgi:phage-related holin